MFETFVTFQGWVGGDVTHRETKDGNVANFRVASTPRLKRRGEWMDGETTWYSVSAWRGLADNIRDSIKRGDPVLVHGRMRTDTWKREDGHTSVTLVVDANLVGHDLGRGTSVFLKSARPDRNEIEEDHEIKEMIHQDPGDLTPLDSFGDPRPVRAEHSAA